MSPHDTIDDTINDMINDTINDTIDDTIDDMINETIDSGTLNALFVLGRSIGFIGHIIDEKRFNSRLYRHPWDDILFLGPDDVEI